MVKTFDSGVEVPLAARVRIPIGAEVGVILTILQKLYILFRSLLEFLATYETQKNITFFSVLFKRMEKNAKNVTFFLKERKRTRRS